MKDSIDPENPLFVTEEAREAVSDFLYQVMLLVKDTSQVCAFGMVTQIQAHFPDLIVYLNECVVSDVACRASAIDLRSFLFHLETLQVSFPV